MQKVRFERLTYEVWISRDEMVDFLLYAASLEASVATRSKMSEANVSGRWMKIATLENRLADFTHR